VCRSRSLLKKKEMRGRDSPTGRAKNLFDTNLALLVFEGSSKNVGGQVKICIAKDVGASISI